LKKKRSGAFFSIGFTVSFSASSMIPWLMGWITDRYGATPSFYPILVLILATVVILPMLWRMRSRIQVASKDPNQAELAGA
jgi:fucose permease